MSRQGKVQPTVGITREEASGIHGLEDRSRSGGRGWRYGFLATGLLVLLAGPALIGLPMLLPQHAWVVKSCASYGITPLPMSAAGLLLCCLFIALRPRRSAPGPEEAQADEKLILGQLASELAQVRSSLQELRVEFVYVKDATQTLLRHEQEQGQINDVNHREDAIFRMAASLDQVGALLDQRLRAQHTAIEDTLQGLGSAVQVARQEIADLAQWLESASIPIGLGSDAHPETGLDAPAPTAWTAPADTPSTSGEAHEQEIWIDLQDAGTPDLGLLDTLDDFGRIQPQKISPSITPVAFHDAGPPENLNAIPSPAAPLPHGRNGTESWPPQAACEDRAALFSVASVGGGISVADKLEQLRSLMSDARVRQALQELRRENGV